AVPGSNHEGSVLMAESQPNRVIVGTCDVCGADVEKGREAHHNMTAPGSNAIACLHCEKQHLAGDLDAAKAALEVLESAVRAALNGHASPQDVAAVVATSI